MRKLFIALSSEHAPSPKHRSCSRAVIAARNETPVHESLYIGFILSFILKRINSQLKWRERTWWIPSKMHIPNIIQNTAFRCIGRYPSGITSNFTRHIAYTKSNRQMYLPDLISYTDNCNYIEEHTRILDTPPYKIQIDRPWRLSISRKVGNRYRDMWKR